MYIHEAIAATTPDKPWITRNAWISNRDGRGMDVVIRLMPTEDLFPITVTARSRYGSNSWYPLKQDLTANDWIPKLMQVLSEILSDKYGCTIIMTAIPKDQAECKSDLA